MFAVGLALAIWAIVTIRRAGTRIVTSGPYRFTRNPVYVGMLLGQAGSYRGAHGQTIEMATEYYACYAKYARFGKIIIAEDARACVAVCEDGGARST